MSKYDHTVRLTRLKNVLIRNVCPDDMRDVMRALLQQAKAGDVDSIKLLFETLFGKPKAQLDVTTGGESVSFTLHLGNPMDDERDDPQLPPPAALP